MHIIDVAYCDRCHLQRGVRVCLSICLCVGAKTAELIKTVFG